MPKPKRNRKAIDATPERIAAPSRNRLWLSLIALGIFLRLVLAFVSIGTNDAAAWLRFGNEINQNGLLKTYTIDVDFNHPPIPGYWAAICATVAGSDDSPWHDSIFTILFKLAPIVGDCLAIYLLYLIWRRKRDKTFALFIAAMFALSLDAIAVSGFHCNTDSLLIALCLLCLYLLQDRSRPLLAGIALAAAINVKIIPVLLIPVLLLQMRSWRDTLRFLTGLAVGVIPFIPALIEVRSQFMSNALQYNSVLDRWGVNYFLLFGDHAWIPTHAGEKLSAAYYAKARYLILALIGLWAVLARIKPRWNIYEAALIPFMIFLIFAPGFGVQYTVLVGVLLFAIRPRWAIAYGILAGLFVSSAYFVNWKGTFPFYSHWGTMFPEPVALLGVATWLLLIALGIHILVRPGSGETGTTLRNPE
jgi:hypothetical protein